MPANKKSSGMTEQLCKGFDKVITQLLIVIYKQNCKPIPSRVSDHTKPGMKVAGIQSTLTTPPFTIQQ